MEIEKVKEILKSKMKDMELSSSDRKMVSVDSLHSVKRSNLSIEAVNKKYKDKTGKSDNKVSVVKRKAQSNKFNKEGEGDIEVKRVRAKNRSTDSNNPILERTVILGDNGILGSQG